MDRWATFVCSHFFTSGCFKVGISRYGNLLTMSMDKINGQLQSLHNFEEMFGSNCSYSN